MKRPFFAIAAGFVLGEAFALRTKMAETGRLWLWAAVLVLGVLGLLGAARQAFWSRKAVPKESETGRGRLLPVFAVLLAAFAGSIAAGVRSGELAAQERWTEDRAGSARLYGELERLEKTGSGWELWVKDVWEADESGGVPGTRDESGSTSGTWGLSGGALEARDESGGASGAADGSGGAGIPPDKEGVGDVLKGSARFEEAAVSSKAAQAPERLLVRAEELVPASEDSFSIGMTVAVEGTLKPLEGPRNPGEFDYRSYLLSQGITGQVSWAKVTAAGGSGKPYPDLLSRLKRYLGGLLEELCGEEEAGLYRSVLLGEKKSLDEEIRDLYQKSGIAHLLAISGLHLSILGMGLYKGFRRLGVPIPLAAACGGAAVASYGMMIGASGSTKRAIFMLLCAFGADWLGRTYDLLSGLGLAAILVSIGEPYQIFQSGFQLSFGAVLGLGLLGKPVGESLGLGDQEKKREKKKFWKKAVRGLLGGLSGSLAVQLATAPIVLYHFFRIPVYGLFLNLLVIPLMAYALYAGLLGMVLGALFPPAGAAVLWLGGQIFRLYEVLCLASLSLPGSSYLAGRPGAGAIAVYYGLVFGAAVLIRRRSEREKVREKEAEMVSGLGEIEEGRSSAVLWTVWKRRLSPALLCFVLLAFAGPFLLRRRPPYGLEVTFLDVGQGDGILLQEGGTAILIDGGSTDQKSLGSYSLEPFLESRGIGELSWAIVSHGDQDHISGLRYLLEESQIAVRRLALPALGKGQEVYGELAELATERGGEAVYLEAGDRIKGSDQGLSLTCLYPEGSSPGEAAPEDRNRHSLILLAQYGDFRLLLTGDAEWEAEEELAAKGALPQVQILKAGHHGSATSTSEELLEAVRPAMAVISCGEGNSYGHPAPETLVRLEQYGIQIWITMDCGAVEVWTDGERAVVKGFLEEPP